MFCAVFFFDIIMVMFAGIPSYALHTCLETVVPNGTFFELKIERLKLKINFPFSVFNFQFSQSLPPRRNRVKNLKTQSRIDSETQRNFETLRLY